ncbi:5006_t:CDS:2, partial [Paraglomus occultum]
NEALTRHFSQFGEVKVVRDYKGHPNQRFVEFWDSRACVRAFASTLNASYNGGYFDCKYAWDISAKQRASNSLLNRLAIKAKEAARYAVRNGYSGALEKVSFADYNNNNNDYQLRLSGGNEEYHLQAYGHDTDILSNGCHGHDSRHYENGVYPSPQLSHDSPPQSQSNTPYDSQYPSTHSSQALTSDYVSMSQQERLEQAQKVQKMLAMVTIQQQQQPHVQAQSTNLQLSLQSITRGSDQCLNPTAITPVINTTFLNGSVAVSSLTNQMYMNGTSNQVSNSISQSSDLSKSGSVSENTSQNTTINHLLALLEQVKQTQSTSSYNTQSSTQIPQQQLSFTNHLSYSPTAPQITASQITTSQYSYPISPQMSRAQAHVFTPGTYPYIPGT